MSAVAEWSQGSAQHGEAQAAAGWSASVVALSAIEAEWRDLEANGQLTPYQRFDWVSAYARHVLPEERAELRIVRIAAPSGRAMAILPFAIKRARGLTIASFIGGKHANFHMGVFARDGLQQLDAVGARRLITDAAEAIGGVDAFILHCQPVEWDGQPNPLALLDAQPSPSQAYKLPLMENCEATLQNSMSSHARKKHKNKRARFAELGPSRTYVAETDAEKSRILSAFLRQKALRFRQMGIADPFASPGVQRFLEAAAGVGGAPAALRLAALELNGEPVATYIGAVAQKRFTGMATSFEPDPAITKVSPGEILLIELIRHECRAGMAVFDLGVGEARYKATICNQTEELVDSFIAISLRGRIAAGLLRLTQRAKAAVKRSPRLHGLAMRIASLARPVRPPASDAAPG